MCLEEPLVFDGAVRAEWPADVRQALAAHLEKSNSRWLAALPLTDERLPPGAKRRTVYDAQHTTTLPGARDRLSR